MACRSDEIFIAPTGQCVPKSSFNNMDEKKYDGSSSVWSYLPEGLTGVAAVIAAIKGTNTAPTINNFGTPNAIGAGGNLWMWIVGIAFLLLIVLVIAFKNRP